MPARRSLIPLALTYRRAPVDKAEWHGARVSCAHKQIGLGLIRLKQYRGKDDGVLGGQEALILPVAQRTLVVFDLCGQTAAFPLESIRSLAPMAELMRPPGLPPTLEGFLNLAGTAIPVVRLDRLFGMTERTPGLYSMLMILKDHQIALLVDRVQEILPVDESAILAVGQEHSFNRCSEAAASVRGQSVPVLSAARILLDQEREVLAKFQAMAQRRLADWGPEKQ